VGHYYQLRDLGVTLLERETLDAALTSGRSVLQALGWPAAKARQQALRFRRHSVDQLEQMAPHFRDEQRLIAMSKQARAQLETLWAQEREEARQRGRGEGWVSSTEDPADGRASGQ
jgi:glutathione-regulated potassium-efflux system ancillary protein KefC